MFAQQRICTMARYPKASEAGKPAFSHVKCATLKVSADALSEVWRIYPAKELSTCSTLTYPGWRNLNAKGQP